MAKGKSKSGSKTFQNGPFQGLKGISVAAAKALPETKPPVRAVKEPVLDDTEVFQREMALLGVEPRTGEDRPPEDETVDTEVLPEKEKETVACTEEELFLSSMGQMDSVFFDEIPLAEETNAAPRRMRQLRQGKRAPEAKLDLHGLNRQEARERVRFFLEDATFAGFKTVLIITGRGKGSAEGPVLRQFMEGYLSNEARAWVVEWGRAPARLGGEGALVVFLKGRRR